jgi:hypothetical protein
MAKRRQTERQKLVTQFRKEKFEKSAFPTEEEASAFAEGLNAMCVPWKTDVTYEILPPKNKVKDWTVYFKVEVEEDEECDCF